MTLNRRAILALVLAAVVVVGTGGVAFGAAPTVDSESTETSSTSELTDGSTVTYNASTNSTLEYSADSNNSSVKIIQADPGNYTLSEFQNGSSPSELSVQDGSANNINFTIADDETGYEGVEAGAGENVTLYYRLLNDTNVDSPDTTNVTIYWENDDNKSFIRGEAGETETADVGLTVSFASSLPLVGSENTTEPAKVEQDIGVNGSDQESITVSVESSDGQDALTETYDAADEAGAVTYDGWVTLDGEFVPVLSSESDAPDWVATGDDTYATVSDDGSEVVIYNAGSSLGDNTEKDRKSVV